AGVTIGSIDTGAFYTHEAIETKYRGYSPGAVFDHNYNWLDEVQGLSSPYEADQVRGHGTHTIGTLVGDNGIGVAPGAKWIAVRGLGPDATHQDVLDAMEWMLAPTDL